MRLISTCKFSHGLSFLPFHLLERVRINTRLLLIADHQSRFFLFIQVLRSNLCQSSYAAQITTADPSMRSAYDNTLSESLSLDMDFTNRVIQFGFQITYFFIHQFLAVISSSIIHYTPMVSNAQRNDVLRSWFRNRLSRTRERTKQRTIANSKTRSLQALPFDLCKHEFPEFILSWKTALRHKMFPSTLAGNIGKQIEGLFLCMKITSSFFLSIKIWKIPEKVYNNSKLMAKC